MPGAYREITTDDVRLLTECGLIKKHGYYPPGDLQTVIGILRYEQLRQKRVEKQEDKANHEPPHCKLCGRPLPPEPERKTGWPQEYCQTCESLRVTQRYRKWRRKRQMALP